MPHLQGLHPWEPMLEFDTTENIFRDKLLKNPLNIQQQVKQNKGRVMIPMGPGLGVEPDLISSRTTKYKQGKTRCSNRVR